jgi:hypothetical protein
VTPETLIVIGAILIPHIIVWGLMWIFVPDV